MDATNSFKNILKELVYIVVPFILYILLGSLIYRICSGFGISSKITAIINGVFCIALFYPLFYIPLKKKHMDDGIRFKCRIKKSTLIWVVLSGFASCFLLNIVVSFVQFDKIITSYAPVSEMLYAGDILLVGLRMVIIAPLMEELLFRGIIYQGIKGMMAKTFDINSSYIQSNNKKNVITKESVIAAVVSSLLFGFLHGNLLQGIYAFILGMVLSILFEKYQSMKPCIIFHMSANVFSLIGTKTSLLIFVFQSGWIMIFYGIMSAMLFILSFVKIISSQCYKTDVEQI